MCFPNYSQLETLPMSPTLTTKAPKCSITQENFKTSATLMPAPRLWMELPDNNAVDSCEASSQNPQVSVPCPVCVFSSAFPGCPSMSSCFLAHWHSQSLLAPGRAAHDGCPRQGVMSSSLGASCFWVTLVMAVQQIAFAYDF